MRPDLLVIAGPNGSGKTTTTEALVQHEWSLGAEYINPDVIAEERFGPDTRTLLSAIVEEPNEYNWAGH